MILYSHLLSRYNYGAFVAAAADRAAVTEAYEQQRSFYRSHDSEGTRRLDCGDLVFNVGLGAASIDSEASKSFAPSPRFPAFIRRPTVALAVVPLALLAACSTGGQRLTRSGFLSDYLQMQPTKGHKKDAIFVDPGYDEGAFSKVIVDPVEWYAPGRDERTKAKLEADFHDRLTRNLSSRYQVVHAAQAGPGVMRLRSAITGTRPARWYYNVPVQAAQLALGGFGLFRPSSGGASEEMQLEDAVTGRVLVKVATYRNGKPWDVSGSYVPYNHARAAFTHASKLLSEISSDPASFRVSTPVNIEAVSASR